MKLSKCLLWMALSLSAAAHAQTSQTYYFGEGQTGFGEGRSKPQRAGEAHTQAHRQTHTQAHSQAKPKHKSHHRRHTTGNTPLQNPYSRP